MPPRSDATELLLAWSHGDETAFDKLVPLVYQELRVLAPRNNHRLTLYRWKRRSDQAPVPLSTSPEVPRHGEHRRRREFHVPAAVRGWLEKSPVLSIAEPANPIDARNQSALSLSSPRPQYDLQTNSSDGPGSVD
jgi:hypothetical protein